MKQMIQEVAESELSGDKRGRGGEWRDELSRAHRISNMQDRIIIECVKGEGIQLCYDEPSHGNGSLKVFCLASLVMKRTLFPVIRVVPSLGTDIGGGMIT